MIHVHVVQDIILNHEKRNATAIINLPFILFHFSGVAFTRNHRMTHTNQDGRIERQLPHLLATALPKQSMTVHQATRNPMYQKDP